jgi:hypothetical protein
MVSHTIWNLLFYIGSLVLWSVLRYPLWDLFQWMATSVAITCTCRMLTLLITYDTLQCLYAFVGFISMKRAHCFHCGLLQIWWWISGSLKVGEVWEVLGCCSMKLLNCVLKKIEPSVTTLRIIEHMFKIRVFYLNDSHSAAHLSETAVCYSHFIFPI